MSDFAGRISALSPERRQLLELLLEKERAGKAKQHRASQKPEGLQSGTGSGALSEPFSLVSAEDRRRLPSDLEDAYPLTMVQLGMLYHMEHEPTSSIPPAYHSVNSFHLQSPIDVAVFEEVVQEVVARHPALRTSFALTGYSEPLQLVHRTAYLPVVVEDLRHLPRSERRQQLHEFLMKENRRLADLSRSPLISLHLHLLTANTWQLTLTEPHAISDGWSTMMTLSEIFSRYFVRLRGAPSPVEPPLSTTFRDYVFLERQILASEAAKSFWSRQLSDLTPERLPRWPTAERSAGGQSNKLNLKFPPAVGEGLERLARRAGASLRSVLVTAHLKVIGLVTGRRDVVIGLSTHGRPETPDAERIHGLFLNTVPLRVDLAPGSWRELVRRVFDAELELMPFRRYPLAALQRLRGGETLFESAFSYLHFHAVQPMLSSGQVGIFAEGNSSLAVTHFPLAVTFERAPAEGGTKLNLTLERNAPDLSPAQVKALQGFFARVLAAMAADPEARHESSSLLAEAARHQLLTEWGGSGERFVADDDLAARFDACARAHLEGIGVSWGDQALSYGAIDARAEQLAARLRDAGVGRPEVRVAICCHRSPEMLAAILGTLKAGAVYVPLDPSYPEARLRHLLSDSGAQAVLTTRELAGQLPDSAAEVLLLDDEWEAPSMRLPASNSNTESDVRSENGAYVIYTSGSTGLPKGVVVSHRNVLRLFAATEEEFGFAGDDVWTLFHSFAFDFSVWEIWGALLYGGRLVVVPHLVSRSPEAFFELLARERVTVLSQTPSAFRQLIRVARAARGELALRSVVFGGEALDLRSLGPWYERFGDGTVRGRGPRLINMYGITETTVHVTYRPLRVADLETAPGSVIGGPLADLRSRVLDRWLLPAPVGTAGELFVGGGGTARCYLGRRALTAQRFLPDPWSDAPGERLYRSGDLARHLPSGELEYLGRNDQQVKVRGFRIELGEIESVLDDHPAVEQSVVLARRDDTPGAGAATARLIAYVVPKSGLAPTAGELRSFLLSRLPEHAVPASFLLLDEIPLTAHGKLDRRALPEPGSERPELDEPWVAPRTPREQALAEVWAQALGLERVGIHDNYFALGGDSIRSIQLVASAKERGYALTIPQLFRHPTIAELAAVVGKRDATPEEAPRTTPFDLVKEEDRRLLPADVEDAYPLSQLQAGMLYHMRLLESLPYHNVDSIFLRLPFAPEPFREALQRAVERHPVMRTSFDLETYSEPLQLVHRAAEMPFAWEDVRRLGLAEQEARIEEYMARETRCAFALTDAPQLRFYVHWRSDDTFQITFTENHAIFDGWSLHATLTEIFRHYRALLRGVPLPVEPPTIPYREFIAQEREAMRSEEARAYWRQVLRDATVLELPQWPGGEESTRRGIHLVPVPLPAEIQGGLRRLASSAGLPIKSVLMAAHLKVLSFISGQQDVMTGLVLNGRAETAGGEETRGLFLNSLPFRLALPAASWRVLARATFEAEQEMLPHRRFPYSLIQQESGGRALFNTTFNYTHFHVASEVLETDGVAVLDFKKSELTDFAFLASFFQNPASDFISLEVSSDNHQLSWTQVRAIGRYYARVLTAIAADPDAPHAAATLLSRAETHQLLVEWRTPPTEVAAATMPALFMARVRQAPDAVALVCGELQVSYLELNRRADRLARYLAERGIAEGSLVGVAMARSIAMVTAWLATLKAGAAYVPLDPAYPADRLRFMVRDSRVALLLCEATALPLFTDVGTVEVVVCDRLELSGADSTPLPDALDPDALANLIYTSGSTGEPKGVAVTHRGVARLVRGGNPADLRADDVLLTPSAVAFDASTMEVWGALLNGARLCIPPTGAPSLAQLGAAIERLRVTAMSFTAGLFHQMVDAEPGALRGIRHLIAGGDVVSAAHVRRHLAGAPASTVFHSYGPTENAVLTTFDRLRAPADVLYPLPLGRPLAATTVSVLDDALRPVPIGVPGELYTGGAGLARGYHRRPRLTAERFLPDPCGEVAGARIYCIGDRARLRPDGRIDFLGRRDNQVKVRGFRIELEEIEATLGAEPAVRRAAVVVRQLATGDKILVAYAVPAVPAEDRDAFVAALRAALAARLPEYMVPTAWVVMDELPLTAHGKLDRRALPDAQLLDAGLGRDYVAPRTPIEELLAGMMAEVLGLERVGAGDSFFDLGGHSLLATQLVSRLRQAFGVEIPLRTLLENATVSSLALRIEVERARGAGQVATPPIAPATRDADLALSFGQKRLWFLEQLQPGNAAYHMPVVLRFEGELDRSALARSLSEVVRRHEVLRTVFAPAGDGVAQRILPPAALPLPVVDLTALAAGERDRIGQRLASAEIARPFDLRRGPVLRLMVVRLGERRHVAVFTLHHVAADGWSMGILVREVAALYTAFATGEPPALPPLPIQYADFAQWQRSWLRGEVLETQLAYWVEHLTGAPAVLELPTDRPRPPVQSFRGRSLGFAWTPELSAALAAFSRKRSVTLFMTLLAALQALFYRYSGKTDVTIGTPIAGRGRLETEALIGLFINTLVLRGKVDGAATFDELLTRAREASLGAYAHQELPFEKLVDALQPERSLSFNPLFQVMFALQTAAVGSLELPGLQIFPFEFTESAAQFDLELAMGEDGGRLAGSLKYATDLFDRTTALRLLGHLERLLHGVLAEPARPLAELTILTGGERQQVTVEWNAVRRELPETSFLPLFGVQAAATPEGVAASCAGRWVSYGELDRRSRLLAGRLAEAGVGAGEVVALLADRGLDFLTAVLGVFHAGAAYLPLDPLHPPSRIAQVLARSRAPWTLCGGAFAPLLAEAVEQLPDAAPGRLPLEETLARRGAAAALPPPAGPGDLAYVIFTSGSTGVPKGAMVAHRGMVNHLFAKLGELALGAGDVVVQNASQCFDISVWQFLAALLAGGRVEIFPDAVAHDPRRLVAAVERERVTILETVPSLMGFVLDELERQGEAAPRFAALRWLVPTGEALPPELSRRWLRRYPRIPLLNAYGPTECSDDVSHHALTRSPAAGALSVPIGRPIPNLQLYVLDRGLRPVPIGVAGQLCVGGPGVGRGYLGDGRRTADVFLPDPFGEIAAARLYTTGDLARHLPDGVLEFLGRLDHQVKVRGFRIELGEIEAALAAHPQVAQAAVTVHRRGAAGPALAAYVAGRGAALETAELRGYLSRELPDYMVPAFFVVLAELPLTANGKVDRKALPPLAAAELERTAPFVSPTTPTEVMVASLWSELLGVEEVGAADDFFELGGHSLLAIRLTARFRDLFQVEVPLRDVFEAPTVAGMARRVELAIAEGAGLAAPPIVPVPRDEELPLSFAQQRLWFLDQLEPGSAAYNVPLGLELRGDLDLAVLGAAFAQVIRRHESLRTTFGTVDGRPVQVIAPPAAAPLPRIDLRHLADGERVARRLINAEARRPFDLAAGPLLRITLLWLADERHAAVLNLHHTVSDGWSTGILLRELAAWMTALAGGTRPDLPPLPIQYADYSRWQRQWMSGEVLAAQLEYWRGQVGGVPVLELPTDRPRPPVQTYRGARTHHLRLSAELTAALNALSRRHHVTLFMTLLASFGALLSRMTGQRDLLTGTPSAGRNRVEVENLIGFFVNTVVLRHRLGGDPSFGELLARTREVALGASAHQDIPFERLVDAVQPDRDMSRNPLFQVMFGLQNAPAGQPQVSGLTMTMMGAETGTAKFDLNLQLSELPQGLTGDLEYNTDLFDATTADRLIQRFAALLSGLVAHPDSRVSQLTVIAPAERHQLLAEWNDSEREDPHPALLHQLAAEQAARTPDAVAALFAARALSYGELERRADRLARLLRSLGVRPGEMVAVYLPRSLEMIPALLGVLKAGGGYLPLEIGFPRDRVRWMLDNLGVRVALCLGAQLSAAAELAAEVPSLAHLVCLDEEGTHDAAGAAAQVSGVAELAAQPDGPPAPLSTLGDVAYVIFTSGSTGRPKGVVVRHRPVCNLIRWVNRVHGVGPEDRVLFITSLCFDLSVYDVFGLLAAGGSIYVASEQEVHDPERLVELLTGGAITYWDSAPAALRQLVPFLPGEPVPDSRLRLVFLSGDWIPVTLPVRVRAAFPAARVVGLGGATEAAIWSNYFPIGEVGASWVSIPYGRPIDNARYHVFDACFTACPIGVPGALYIGGGCLAAGYSQAPTLTAAQFVPDPYGAAGAVLYATGDRARYLADGNLEFLGRLDFQVKIRGFRIELGEIESVLAQHPQVREAVALARPAPGGGRDHRLVAYVVPAAGAAPDPRELREHLLRKLPEYMLPAAFVTLDALPVTANGKLDRRALPAPETGRQGLDSDYQAPRTPAEEVLARIWSELLNVERIGVHDNFFELGGDSILSIQIIARANRVGLRLTARQVFQHQTVAELAAVAGSLPELAAEQGLVLGEAPLTPVQRWFFEQELTAPHHWNQALIFEVRERFEPALLARALDALLVHHDALRLRFLRAAEGWRQVSGRPAPGRTLTTFDLSALGPADKPAALATAAAAVQGGLSLAGELVRVALFRLGGADADRLLAVIHHLAIDGVSWRILLEDLQTAYAQLRGGEPIVLPAKTTPFKEWAERLALHARTPEVAAELPYWTAGAGRAPALPVDLPGENLVGAEERVTVRLAAEETRALLQEVPPVYRTQINDALLAALVRAFGRWTGAPALRLDLEGHGRDELADDLDVSRTVGWFTVLYPVLLDVAAAPGPGAALKAVKEQLRAVPAGGRGYGLLRYLGDDETAAALRRLPPAQVSFNYLGQLDQALAEDTPFRATRDSSGPGQDPRQRRPYLIEVNASVLGGRMELSLTYGGAVHRRETMERLLAAYGDALRELVAHCRRPEAGGYTPSDFPLARLDQARLDALAGGDRTIEDVYPLTPLQEGLLFHTLEAPGTGMYVQQLSATLNGDLDAELFGRAWQLVVDRHPIFRTSFVWRDLDRPLQVVRSGVTVALACHDWRDLAAAERGERLRAYFEADRLRGFDVADGPLLRLHLIRLADGAARFCWTHHHLVIDGWSMPLVIDQVLSAYAVLRAGGEPPRERPRPYRDYIAWLERQSLVAAESYWRAQLAGFTAPTALAIDRGRRVDRPARYEEVELSISRQGTAELEALARRHQLTLNNLFQGAWALLLARYSGEEDVLFGTTVSGRPAELPGVESMVGLFINTLPVRTRVPADAELLAWLRELQDRQAEMRQYEYTPLVAIQGWSEVPRGAQLFETVMVFENYPVSETPEGESGGGSLGIAQPDFAVTTNYPLMLVAKPDRELPLGLRFDATRFNREAMRHLLWQLRTLLEEVVAEPRRPLGAFSLVTPEAAQLLADPAAPLARPRHELVPDALARWASAAADRPALRQGELHVGYGELLRRADALAAALVRQGLAPGDVAAVLAPRGCDLIVAMVGVLRAGGVLLTVDRSLPPARQRLMLEEAACRHALYAGAPRDADAWLWDGGARSVLHVDAAARPAAPGGPDAALPAVAFGDPAYVFFTSGTTGKPKGVLGWHGALAHFLAWQRETFAVADGDRAAQLTGVSFDVVLRDVFLPLTGGALLTVPADGADLGADVTLPWLEREAVTRIHTVPSIARAWLADTPAGVRLAALRTVFFAGEPLTDALVAQWRRTFPDAGELVNLYGPTETTLAKACFRVPAEPEPGVQPIGTPLPNAQVLVLAPDGRRCGVGEPGELVVRTPFRSRGYLDAAADGARRFAVNPYTGDPDDLLYRSGDRGLWRPDGALQILGRLDDQVKVRGVRVEPGEVGAVLESHPQVSAAAVLARPRDGRTELVAYVVVAAPAGASADAGEPALRRYLGERLPPALVPAAFVFLPALPLTANGKLDRRALPEPPWHDERPEPAAAPRNPVEEVVAGVWAAVLGRDTVGVDDDFFELGGHSLLATQVLSRLRRIFRVELELRDLFAAPRPALLAARLAAVQQAGEGVEAPPLVARDRGGEEWLPLSFAQQRMWFLEQLDPGSRSYNIFTPVHLRGAIDAPLLERALNEIARRHEPLRTAFGTQNGKPAQRISPPRPFTLPLVDLSALPRAAGGREVLRLASVQAGLPFDLTRPRQQRAALVRLAPAEHAFLLTMHHIISDAWSLGIVVRELATLYTAFAAGRPSPLRDLAVQYADFAAWQRDWLRGEVLERQLTYWQGQLAGAPGGLDLPFDRPRPPLQTFRGKRLPLLIPAALSHAVRGLGRPQTASLYMTLLAAFDVLLARTAGVSDVVLGSPIANRNRVEIEPLIGFFVNTLVLRTDLGDDPDFHALLGRVRDLSLDAFNHQDLPFEQLVEHLHPERDLSRHPVFQVVFVLQNVPFGRRGGASPVEVTSFAVDEGVAKFDLTLVVHDEGRELMTEWEYNSDLFDRTTVLRLQRHFQNLLAAAVAAPRERVSRLALLEPAERQQLLAEWNVPAPAPAAAIGADATLHGRFSGGRACGPRPPAAIGADATLHGRFAARAARDPGATAVVLGEARLSYGELDRRAERLARRLQALGVGAETLVALAVERSLEMVVGILAILKAGGAYVPLDPAYPADRLAFMLADTGAPVVLTLARLADGVRGDGREVLLLDDPASLGPDDAAPSPAPAAVPASPAYVIYTSGSTGRPKGVVVTHTNVLRLFASTEGWFDFSARDVWSLFHSYAFDFSVWEIWGALLYGGRLVVVPHDVSRSPALFYRLLCAEGVTVLSQTPSAFRQLMPAAAAGGGGAAPAVRCVVFGGEALDLPGLSPWFARQGDRSPRLINMYGITETTVHVTYRPIRAADAAAGRGSLIGVAIPDLRLVALGPGGRPVPVGVGGEMHVGGAGLARGYLRRPALTAERFVPDPFAATPGARLYRSGDLARYRGDGDLEYLGRIDHQVKVRGFRIELGEIEAALQELPAIAQAVVLAQPAAAGDPRLVAFLVAAGEVPSVNELRRLLGGRLPEHMIPAQFVPLTALPLTPSGKVDRRALVAPEGARLRLEEAYEPPRTPLEALLAEVWAGVLEVERVGIDDNFFALGGDSMRSLTIIAQAQEAGVVFPLQEVYRYQTVRELSAALQAGAGDLTGFDAAPALDEDEELARMLDEIEGLSAEELSERLEE